MQNNAFKFLLLSAKICRVAFQPQQQKIDLTGSESQHLTISHKTQALSG